jgi:hypothetical protein
MKIHLTEYKLFQSIYKKFDNIKEKKNNLYIFAKNNILDFKNYYYTPTPESQSLKNFIFIQ